MRFPSNIRRRTFLKLGIGSALFQAASRLGLTDLQGQTPPDGSAFYTPFVWPNKPPDGMPFQQSDVCKGIRFTGRHREYTHADTWFPTWAQDGNLYSPFQDGGVQRADGKNVSVNGGFGKHASSGYAQIIGTDPLNLTINPLGTHTASALPYGGRYASASLIYNGTWYMGTYCCDVLKRTVDGVFASWASLEPFVGFMVSRNYGQTWEETPHTPWSPLFPEVGDRSDALRQYAEQKLTEPDKNWQTSDVRSVIHDLPQIKIGTPHFADFGLNMEHSPDGKAYLVGHGTIEPDPMPRFANNSWVAGDQIFMVRVKPSPETINDPKAYEFFGGYDEKKVRVWTDDFAKIKPLIDWNNHCGCVTVTYNAVLKRYLMCVADAWPGDTDMNSYILESTSIEGPWKLVTYMEKFGQQGYFLNKFISPDGRKGWLCYSGN